MTDPRPFNPNSVADWINVLHTASAVPKGHADYDEARQIVALANRKIKFLNRAASRSEVETPDAPETARMTALESTAGAAAALPVGAVSALMGVVPGPSGPLQDFISRIAGKAALDLKGVDPDAYERGVEAHPTAAAAGEMTPAVLMALLGKLGAKPGARMISERLKPLPEAAPPRPRGFTTNESSVASAARVSQSDPLSRLLALLHIGKRGS